MQLTREEVMERLRTENVYITTARTPFFDEVPERKIRYVVYIWIFGDRVTTREVYIEKLEEDGTYSLKFDSISVAAPEKVMLPKKHDILNPIISLEGGTRLYGRVSGNSLTSTIQYWDNDV